MNKQMRYYTATRQNMMLLLITQVRYYLLTSAESKHFRRQWTCSSCPWSWL